ncbi:MAG: dihydrodipicolinate synthase family protein [Saprospiraceae bacterium]
MAVSWKGVFPAITTKFTSQNQLDLGLFKKNLSAQLDAGINGIVLGGSLGEASVLTNDEKEILVKETLLFVEGKVPVIINIAEGSTDVAIELAQKASLWGAQGLMLLPPMRYKADDRETVQYFKDVAESTSLPIMIYNNPVDYKIDVTIDMFAELASISNIQAIKESTRDVTNVTRLRNAFGDRFSILCGVDTLALEELVLGADGWVAGLVCAFPAETVAVFKLVKAGRIEEAINIYRWFMPLLELDIHSKLVQYIKLAESKTGLGSEFVRRPRLILEGAERQRIENIIDTGIKNRPVLPNL